MDPKIRKTFKKLMKKVNSIYAVAASVRKAIRIKIKESCSAILRALGFIVGSN